MQLQFKWRGSRHRLTSTNTWSPGSGTIFKTFKKWSLAGGSGSLAWSFIIWSHFLLALCFLTADTRWPATSCPCHHDGLHPFFLRVLEKAGEALPPLSCCSRVFGNNNGKSNEFICTAACMHPNTHMHKGPVQESNKMDQVSSAY